jgi:cell division protein FtsL
MRARHFAMLCAVTLMTCAFVWVRLRIVSISYDINELGKKERELREQCNSLTLEITEARSPQRLERIASTKLGMKPPRVDQLIMLSEKAH